MCQCNELQVSHSHQQHGRSRSNSETKQFLPPDALARQAIANSSSRDTSNDRQSLPQRPLSAHELATNWRKPPTSAPVDDTQAIINAIVSSGSGAETAARIGYSAGPTTLPPSGYVPDQDKKEFCTYWIRTGECDYMQQGCLYKHEMPDMETLRKIGFRSYPAWWTKKTQITRMDGEKATIGPIVKPSVWLNRASEKPLGSGDEASESSASESESVSYVSNKSTRQDQTTKESIRQKPKFETPVSTPLRLKARNQSVTGDLIQFEPLLPTPSTTPSLTPASSDDSPPSTSASNQDSASDAEPKQKYRSKTGAPYKVFIPAGESARKHIAEADKLITRKQTSTTRSIAATNVPALDKQIQVLQKRQNDGLMASKHAPPTNTEHEPSTQRDIPAQRVSKSGCRTRRPASSVATSTGAKK